MKRLLFVAIVLGLVASLLACSQPTPVPSPAPAPAPAPTTVAPKPASPAPAPTTTVPKTTTPSPTPSPTGPPYFQGKVITIVAAAAAGGGTDVLARLVARHISRHIPGNPAIIVRNIPGGGSLEGANFVYKAKPNGLTAWMTGAGGPTNNLLRPKGTEYHLEEQPPILTFPRGTVFYSDPKILTEAKDIPRVASQLISGGISPTGTAYIPLTRKLLEVKFGKEIYGYGGAGEYRAAFLAGEVNLCGASPVEYTTAVKEYEKLGKVVPLMQTGILDAKGNVIREEAAPNVPTVDEVYKQIYGKAPSGIAWDAYKRGVVGLLTFSKVLVLPPKTPDNIVQIWWKAAIAMSKDAIFLDDLEKMSPDSPIIAGEQLAKSFIEGVSAPPELVQWLREFFTVEYGVVF